MRRPNLATCNRRTAVAWIKFLEAENVRLTDRIVVLEGDRPAVDPVPPMKATRRKRDVTLYPKAGTDAHVVLIAVAQAGQRGLTRDELAVRLNRSLNTFTGRITELVEGGWLRHDPNAKKRKTRTGKTGKVLVLTDRGYRAVTAEGHAVQEPPPVTPVPPELQGSL